MLFLNLGIGVADGYEFYIIAVLFYGSKVVFGYAAAAGYGDTDFTAFDYWVHGKKVLSYLKRVLSAERSFVTLWFRNHPNLRKAPSEINRDPSLHSG